MDVDHRPSKGANCRWLDASGLNTAETGKSNHLCQVGQAQQEIDGQSTVPPQCFDTAPEVLLPGLVQKAYKEWLFL